MQRPNLMADFLTKRIDSPKTNRRSIRIANRNALLFDHTAGVLKCQIGLIGSVARRVTFLSTQNLQKTTNSSYESRVHLRLSVFVRMIERKKVESTVTKLATRIVHHESWLSI